MPEPDPPAAIRTPNGAAPATGGLPGETPPFPVPDHALIRRIGKGAYGEVWLARNALGTWRAVKFVRRSSFDDDKPFEREFAGIQRFEPISRSHESQLNILHVGRAEDGFYYVMELADDMGRGQEIDEATYTARNLRSELHLRGRLPAAECLRIGLALTTALEHLHKHGLVHRDIKPSNIVFVNGIPKLADIGLVARAEAAASFVGTEGFLPPEGPGTRQADIFSLGKVLYEISTGHDRNQFPELPTNIIELPDRSELSELNEVLLKACHRDPKERYQTAAEMHAELALLESGRSVLRLRGIERKLRTVQRAGAIVTAMATLAAGLYLWQAKQTRRISELAGQNRERVVRLNIANGVRLLDQDDPAGALLWFAEALPLVARKPVEESIHRIRIQQTLNHTPHLLNVFPHAAGVNAAVFSPDEKRLATACEDGVVRLWETPNNQEAVAEFAVGAPPVRLRFGRNGQRLFVFTARQSGDPNLAMDAIVRDLSTKAGVFPAVTNFTSCELSPDEQWLAVAHSNLIQILSAQTGEQLAELRGHESSVVNLSFSADSRQLISASLDRTARRWEIPAGKPIGEPLRHASPVWSAKFSPDAGRIATATFRQREEDRVEIQVWDSATSTRLGTPAAGESRVFVLTFDPSGRRLLMGDLQHALRAMNAADGSLAPRGWKLNSFPCSFDWSRNNELALGGDNGAVSLWDVAGERNLCASQLHYGRIESVQFDRAGRRLLTASGDGTVKLWDLALAPPTGTVRLTADIPGVEPGELRPSLGREPGPLPIPLKDGTVCLFDLDQMRELHRLQVARSNSPPNQSVSAPDGRHWALYRWSPEDRLIPVDVDLFGEASGVLRHLVLEHPAGIYEVSFSSDSDWLFTCARDLIIRVWRVSDGRLERTIEVPKPFARVDFHPDMKSALLTEDEVRCQWFDLDAGRLIGREFHRPGGWKTEFDPGGQRLAIVGRDQSARIWGVGTGEPLTPPFKHGGTVLDLDWSPDGRRVTTAGVSAEARIWDAATGEQVLSPLVIGSESVRTARWSPDGRFIVTRSDDRFVRVWDAATAEPVTPLLRQEGFIRLACLRANNRLIVGCDPNIITAWDLRETQLPPEALADYAKLLAGRRVSATGALLPLKPEELAELCRSLRARAPQLFE